MYDSVRCLIVPNEIILDVMTKIYGCSQDDYYTNEVCIKQHNTGICKLKSGPMLIVMKIPTCETDFTGICNDKVTNDQCMANHVFNLLIHNHCTNDIWFTNGYCISGHVKDCIDYSDTANITSKICNIQVDYSFVLLTGIYKISLFFVQVCKINSFHSRYMFKQIENHFSCNSSFYCVVTHFCNPTCHKHAQVFILTKSLDRSCKSKSCTATDLGKVQKCNVDGSASIDMCNSTK
ncbi:hypothetical protein ACTA71_001936 [Dictyostelium dimigraforme]